MFYFDNGRNSNVIFESVRIEILKLINHKKKYIILIINLIYNKILGCAHQIKIIIFIKKKKRYSKSNQHNNKFFSLLIMLNM